MSVLFAMAFLPAALVTLKLIASGFDRPVQAVSARDGSGALYVAEQPGRIRRADGTLFLDLSNVVDCCENGGLLSVVFHPQYRDNGRLFVLYVDRRGDTAIAEYRRSIFDPTIADPASARVLLTIDQPELDVPNHHGGTLQFGPDGDLYVSIGDGGVGRGVTNRAQDLTLLLGKILRIDVDSGAIPYAIPPANPFGNEIWAYGLRNPWRFSFDDRGDVILGDVGEHDWEELNVLPLAQSRGANFGWPITEGRHCFPPGSSCATSGLTLPLIEYSSHEGCAITAGYRYRGERITALRDAIVYGDWCSGAIWAATDSGSVSPIADTAAAIVSFAEGDDGELYVVDYLGGLYAVEPVMGRRRAVGH